MTQITSMTGCGTAQETWEQWSCSVDIRSVNSRFLEINIHLPSQLQGQERLFRQTIQSYARRGRIDCSVCINHLEQTGTKTMQINTDIAKKFKSDLVKLETILDQKIQVRWSDLKHQQIVTYQEQTLEEETSQDLANRTLEQALITWNEMRQHEGKILLESLQQHLATASSHVQEIQEIAKNLPQLYLEKLEKNLQKLLSDSQNTDIDTRLLAQEVALFAEKKDISEELARLDAHFHHFETLFQSPESGKQAGFLTQECLREINTIASKTQSAEVSILVVAVKSELEKIKEQLSNIE